jgi:integrase
VHEPRGDHADHELGLFALYRLGATTGAHRGEQLGVQWRDLDFDAGRLRIERQVLPTKGGVTFGPTKSAGRTVKLDPETVEALRRHLAVQKLERDVAGEAYEDGDLIFCNELGRIINPQVLSQWFVKLREAAGIPTGSIHVLRHTCATLALSKGIDLTTVARRLGDNEVTILRTYSHLVPSADEKAAEVLAGVFADKPLTNSPV